MGLGLSYTVSTNDSAPTIISRVLGWLKCYREPVLNRTVHQTNLYFGSLVPDDPRDGGQRGELVRGHLRVHPGQVGEEGGLAHGGEPWQGGEQSVG